ncbi:nudix hydrolase [Acrasis kona]|uniref:Nudix hydrolase n=1 Tax=Acrasis kona TaxID=1008807 RepID=A0AAW2ZKB1_9EUKA
MHLIRRAFGVERALPLLGKSDVFKGLTIDLSDNIHSKVLKDPRSFQASLKRTIEDNTKEGTKGLWLKIPIEQSELVPIATKLGFEYHHAERNYVMMTSWLPDVSKHPNKLPRCPQHFIGAGGAAIDVENRQILLITERTEFFPSSGEKIDHWKIPGGQLDDPDESIGDCAVREVYEETGVKTEFKAVLSFRHLHNFRFEKSDIYFICLLSPIDKTLNPDPVEIDKCQWVSLDEYFAMDKLRPVQKAAMNSVKEYIKDPNKCLKTYDVSPSPIHRGLMYKV